MNPTSLAPLGVYAVTVTILVAGIKVLWVRYQAALKQNHDDQAAMLPVLTEAAQVLRQAIEELIRTRALDERNRQ